MLNFRFEELGSERTFVSSELQSIAKGSPLTKHRKQYKVYRDAVEVAYVDFDFDRPEGNNLYLLYVAKNFRNQGIGSECLKFAVQLTKDLGRPRLLVRPAPFGRKYKNRAERKTAEKKLKQWYINHGFKPMRGKPFTPPLGMPRLLGIELYT